MNRPPERDFSDFVSSLPVGGESGARLLLWDSIEREQSRRSRRRSTRRTALLATAIFVVWSMAPATIDTSAHPLLGLASAVAESGPLVPGAPDVWYERIERTEHFAVDPQHVEALGARPFQFEVSTVVETWIGSDSVYRTRVTYGTPRFETGGDERVFDLARLQDRYPVNKVVESIGQFDDGVAFDPPWALGPSEVLTAMERQVRTTTDTRPHHVQILDLAVALLRDERNVPAHRAILFRVLAEIDDLAVMVKQDQLVISVRFVSSQSAFEKRVVLDRDTGALVSATLERLATPSIPSRMLETQTFAFQTR
jgi:hypothetical protein